MAPSPYRVALESAHDPSPERSVAPTHPGRAQDPRRDQPCAERARQPCRTRQDPARPGGRRHVHCGRALRRAPLQRCRGRFGGPLQPRGRGGPCPPAWGWASDPLCGRRTRAHPDRVPPHPRSRAGWHGPLVAHHLAAGVAPRARRLAPRQHVHDLVCPARGRLHVAAESHLVRHRHRGAQAQGGADHRH